MSYGVQETCATYGFLSAQLSENKLYPLPKTKSSTTDGKPGNESNGNLPWHMTKIFIF